MEIKLFEVRDRATHIPVMCIRLDENSTLTDKEIYLLNRCGFGGIPGMNTFTFYHPLEGMKDRFINYDTSEWNDRTHKTAHEYIDRNWYSLETGAVVDVMYILGETATRVQSDYKPIG